MPDNRFYRATRILCEYNKHSSRTRNSCSSVLLISLPPLLPLFLWRLSVISQIVRFNTLFRRDLNSFMAKKRERKSGQGPLKTVSHHDIIVWTATGNLTRVTKPRKCWAALPTLSAASRQLASRASPPPLARRAFWKNNAMLKERHERLWKRRSVLSFYIKCKISKWYLAIFCWEEGGGGPGSSYFIPSSRAQLTVETSGGKQRSAVICAHAWSLKKKTKKKQGDWCCDVMGRGPRLASPTDKLKAIQKN